VRQLTGRTSDRDQERTVSADATVRLFDQLAGPDGLTEHASTFTCPDLPRLSVGVDPHGDEPDRTPLLFGHPRLGGVILANGFHVASLCRCPVRVERLVDRVAQDRAERLEHWRPGA
jgi:hypothetical protein